MHLSMANYPAVEFDTSFMNKFSPICLAIQFTCLHIWSSSLLIGTLVKLIGLLANLDSLIMSFASLEQISLSIEDAESLRLVSINNKITRVCVPMKFNLIHVLMKLCPRMKYLELKHVENKDLKKLVRLILKKTLTSIPHLCSTCFYVINVNDDMIRDLEKMIDSEKLLLDYNITRKCNDIVLQWKSQ